MEALSAVSYTQQSSETKYCNQSIITRLCRVENEFMLHNVEMLVFWLNSDAKENHKLIDHSHGPAINTSGNHK